MFMFKSENWFSFGIESLFGLIKLACGTKFDCKTTCAPGILLSGSHSMSRD